MSPILGILGDTDYDDFWEYTPSENWRQSKVTHRETRGEHKFEFLVHAGDLKIALTVKVEGTGLEADYDYDLNKTCISQSRYHHSGFNAFTRKFVKSGIIRLDEIRKVAMRAAVMIAMHEHDPM